MVSINVSRYAIDEMYAWSQNVGTPKVTTSTKG
jgi:hypothetical protein